MSYIDFRKLKYRCRQSIEETMYELGTPTILSNNQMYCFKDNDSSVLAVAHLDTAFTSKVFKSIRITGDKIAFSPMLDDRLGVYTILDLLPKLGVKVDILLTEDEELGMSTAMDFKANKQYNWIVEFDRAGTDAVIYDYSWQTTISKYFTLGAGSFSDISDLDTLGCQAVNIGIGYHQAHTKRCFFSCHEYTSQITKFLKFWHAERSTHYPFTPSPYTNKRLYDNYWWEASLDEDPFLCCPACATEFLSSITIKEGQKYLCPTCGHPVDDKYGIPTRKFSQSYKYVM